MRKLLTTTFVTLDGIMQAPGGPDEDRTNGFTHGGWSMGYWDDMMNQVMGELMGKPFDLLLGRRTYEIFAAYWPDAGDQAVAGPFNAATKYVASRTLHRVDWKNSQLLRGDAVKAVAALKQGNGPEIQVHGSGRLVQTLLETDLIDELRLWTFPVILGTGQRLFEGGAIPTGLELVDSRTSSTGVVVATYKPGAAINYGSAPA
jgi:dihydrofolate reductase